MQEKNSGREPVVWVADVRCEGVDCRQNTRTQECKKCAKVEEILYLYGVKMYRGGEKDGNIGESGGCFRKLLNAWSGVGTDLCTVVL